MLMDYTLSKEMMLTFSRAIYASVQEVIDDDVDIIKRLQCIAADGPYVMSGYFGEDIVATALSADLITMAVMLGTQDGVRQLVALARWAHFGFPQVTMGHKFTAALLVTNATEEAVNAAMPPFPAFIIEVPNGLLFITDPHTGEPDPVRRILLMKQVSDKLPCGWTWSYTAYSEKGISLFRYGVSSLELLPAWLDGPELAGGRTRNDDKNFLSFEPSESDKRMTALIGRLIVNTCLAFSDPTKVKEVGPGHAQWKSKTASGKNRKSDQPITRTFQVGAPVKHDFREHIRNYIAGIKREVTVQVLVTGFHRMQPHGPKQSLRKLIWVEPFWRGPEGAPIALRPHSF
jgi:hypothetical protein